MGRALNQFPLWPAEEITAGVLNVTPRGCVYHLEVVSIPSVK